MVSVTIQRRLCGGFSCSEAFAGIQKNREHLPQDSTLKHSRKVHIPIILKARLISAAQITASSHFKKGPDVDKRTLGMMDNFFHD